MSAQAPCLSALDALRWWQQAQVTLTIAFCESFYISDGAGFAFRSRWPSVSREVTPRVYMSRRVTRCDAPFFLVTWIAQESLLGWMDQMSLSSLGLASLETDGHVARTRLSTGRRLRVG
jgi:hypothetical protein